MHIYLIDNCFSGRCNNPFLAFLFERKCIWESLISNLFLPDLELVTDWYVSQYKDQINTENARLKKGNTFVS